MSFGEVGREGREVSPRRNSDMEGAMTGIDIDRTAPMVTRLSEDGELVAELFRDEAGFEEEPPFNVVDLSEDPRGPKRIYVRESLVATARWTVDPYPVR